MILCTNKLRLLRQPGFAADNGFSTARNPTGVGFHTAVIGSFP
jgi:hypothetical protein